MTFYKKYIEKAIIPTIVITLVFFMNYFLFGMNNTMIGPFITLSFMRFRNISNHYECMLKSYVIYVIMTILASVACLNIVLCILVNAAALFWLAYLLIDEYNPTNYFPAGMALIFFQMAPAWGRDLVIRLEALSASFAIIFVVIVLLSLKRKKDPIRDYILTGMELCDEMISLCEKERENADLQNLQQKLCDTNKQISGEIYIYNRASIRMAGKVNWYCQFVALFQVINSLCFFQNDAESIASARALLSKYRHAFETVTPKSDYKRLNFREKKPDIRSFRMRFALRLVLVMTPCIAFSYLSGWENVYWLVISVFFMMVPVTENTISRVRQRFAGTICGIMACFVLFYLFPTFPERVVLMTIANFLIYGAQGYGATVAYITCSALAVTSLGSMVVSVLLQRLIYTGAGAVITLIVNKLVFPIYTGKEMVYLKEMLAKQRTAMQHLSDSNLSDSERKHQKDQALIKSYMLIKRLQAYHAMLPDACKDPDFANYERAHAMSMAAFLSL